MKEVKAGDEVTFIVSSADGKKELKAEVLHVWTQQCVNLLVEDGSRPTSVMRADYFPTLPAGHYWKL